MTARRRGKVQTAAADALFQFAAGIDEGNATLLGSVMAPAASVDFGPCSAKLGMAFPPLKGRDEIVHFLAATSVHQVTSHVVTNIRVSERDVGLAATALVETTHVVRDDPGRRFRMLDRYDIGFSRDRNEWLIEQLVIDNVWFEGDPEVLLVREGSSDAAGA